MHVWGFAVAFLAVLLLWENWQSFKTREILVALIDDLNAIRDELAKAKEAIVAKIAELEASLAAAQPEAVNAAVSQLKDLAQSLDNIVAPAPAPAPEPTPVVPVVDPTPAPAPAPVEPAPVATGGDTGAAGATGATGGETGATGATGATGSDAPVVAPVAPAPAAPVDPAAATVIAPVDPTAAPVQAGTLPAGTQVVEVPANEGPAVIPAGGVAIASEAIHPEAWVTPVIEVPITN